MFIPKLIKAATVVALFTALTSASSAAWIAGKAVLAQHLLDIAWQKSRYQNVPAKPWQWADIATVGRLSIPASNKSLIVLSDASGEAMAFGPGLVAGDLAHAETSTIAIGGHRDTHLAFMQDLKPGDLFLLETTGGKTHQYRLLDSQIADTRVQSLSIAAQSPGLVLITCYPFNARQTGGPLRMVVRAAWQPT